MKKNIDFSLLQGKTIENVRIVPAGGDYLIINFTDGTMCLFFTKNDKFRSNYYYYENEAELIEILKKD
jgi:hypothetical protein